MEIELLSEQNPWWVDRERIYEDEKVKEATSKKHRINYSFHRTNKLLVGPRQVGKTTFLKLFIKHLIDSGFDPHRIFYLSCEPVKDFKDIIDVVRFSDSMIRGEKYIFFDEITFVKEWHRAIKYIMDSSLIRDKVVYVTGSSSIALKKETFPGRPLETWYFLPMRFKDFCMVFGSENLKKEISGKVTVEKLMFYFSEIQELFNSYIKCGGFPRSMYELMENGKIREETYDIYWKWLISDIAKIERSEKIASSVILGVLKNYGTKFSLNSIAKEMEIGSHVTVREYLEILEDLFVLRNIFPIDMRRGTGAFRRMRKVYFIDPFLFHVFKKQLTGKRVSEKDYPALVEGIVAEHLARNYGKLFYFYEKKEVDFYVEKSLIEVKWQKKVKKSDFPKVEMDNRILLSRDVYEFVEDENLKIIPASIFLLL